MKMNSDVEPIPTGYWVRNATNIFFTDFGPGVYTVVAGDEWDTMCSSSFHSFEIKVTKVHDVQRRKVFTHFHLHTCLDTKL